MAVDDIASALGYCSALNAPCASKEYGSFAVLAPSLKKEERRVAFRSITAKPSLDIAT